MKVSPFESQIFFDDSVRNIASGKAAGLQTVVVSSLDFSLEYPWFPTV